MALKHVKRIRYHSAYAQFIAECAEDEVGVIPRQSDIPSPYASSPEWPVWDHMKYGPVVVRETRHRVFDVYAVSPDLILKGA